jgi:hypothetical protein
MEKRFVRIRRNVPLDVTAIGHQLNHWEAQLAAAKTEREQGVAEGNINALEMMLVLHGMPIEKRRVA